MKTIYVKPKDVVHKWFVIDATGKTLGRVAVKAASIARGKHKPYYVLSLNYGFVYQFSAQQQMPFFLYPHAVVEKATHLNQPANLPRN